MVRITADLLRKRAEHNEGIISTLEEVTLHQQEIEKIESINQLCRHLKILYLQNNIIKNLNRLKELEYLNLALNNITVIENLSSCESLKKLDLTVNFIDLDTFQNSIEHLQLCYNLVEIYLTGNPCTDWDGYRSYVIGMLPQLQRIDGKDITKSERILASQQMNILKTQLETEKKLCFEKKSKKTNEPNAYTPESRTIMYRKLMEEKEEREKQQKDLFKSPDGDPIKEYREKHCHFESMSQDDVLPRQRNLGNWGFRFFQEWKDENSKLILEIDIPRYVSTSSIEIDIQPLFFQMIIKKNMLLLHLPAEVIVSQSNIQRIENSGLIVVNMALINPQIPIPITQTQFQYGDSCRKILKSSRTLPPPDLSDLSIKPDLSEPSKISNDTSNQISSSSNSNHISISSPKCLSGSAVVSHSLSSNLHQSINDNDNDLDDSEVPPLETCIYK